MQKDTEPEERKNYVVPSRRDTLTPTTTVPAHEDNEGDLEGQSHSTGGTS